MTEKSGEAFYEAVKFHKRINKIDLNKNLVPIKFIKEINKKCSENNEQGDDKVVPRLKKEFKQVKILKNKGGDLEKYQSDYHQGTKLESTLHERCSELE